MVDIEELKDQVTDFRDERDWKRYHNPRDLSMSISIEAAELLELFQWDNRYPDDVDRSRLEEEVADILIYLLSLADVAEIDLERAVRNKIKMNEEKYPVEDHETKRF
ncbi:MAG: nucleotide pyrophosphohydrolase [Thermoplasmatota archaeon]